MPTEDVNIVGVDGAGPLYAWANESTQKQVASSLRQIQADNRAMLRYTLAMSQNDKNANKYLSAAVATLEKIVDETKKTGQKEQGNRTQQRSQDQRISSGILSTVSAIVDVKSTLEDAERRGRKAQGITDSLLLQGFSQADAERGAKNEEFFTLSKKLADILKAFGGAVVGVAAMATGAVQIGYQERFSMVAELRQAGLLASLEDTEAGFVAMSKTISATNFTFGEATQFTKQFAKTVGVLGVKSALTFANTVASSDVSNGMGYMKKYALEFGQVSEIAGEYLETLRIGGQLRTISDSKRDSGMNDFMSNVEMTANVLKISMEDAANLMQKALGPESVALLATLPKQQREAIEKGFLSVNAQGNPMAETLAKRLAAGSRGAFLQTAEFQEMAGTSVGREVLNFVEQMASQLENGTTDDFQAALAEGFPEFADRLTEMAQQGGVRIQLLNDTQLASMVGSIIEAAQTYGDADKGTTMGADREEEQLFVDHLKQQRQALLLNEDAMTTHMTNFNNNLKKLIDINTDFAHQAALTIATWDGTINFLGEVSTTLKTLKSRTFEYVLGTLTTDSFSEEGVRRLLETMTMQNAGTPLNLEHTGDLSTANKYLDANYQSLEGRYDELSNMESIDEKFNAGRNLQIESVHLLTQMAQMMTLAKEAGTMSEAAQEEWKLDWKVLKEYITKIDAFVAEQQSERSK